MPSGSPGSGCGWGRDCATDEERNARRDAREAKKEARQARRAARRELAAEVGPSGPGKAITAKTSAGVVLSPDNEMGGDGVNVKGRRSVGAWIKSLLNSITSGSGASDAEDEAELRGMLADGAQAGGAGFLWGAADAVEGTVALGRLHTETHAPFLALTIGEELLRESGLVGTVQAAATGAYNDAESRHPRIATAAMAAGVIAAVTVDTLIPGVGGENRIAAEAGEAGEAVVTRLEREVAEGASRGVGPTVYKSIRESGGVVEGFKAVRGGLTKNTVKNLDKLEQLRAVEPGSWSKVYKDGFDAAGNKVSVHYFESASGAVAEVKTVPGWSNL